MTYKIKLIFTKYWTWQLSWRTFLVTQLTSQLPWQSFLKKNWLYNCLKEIVLVAQLTWQLPWQFFWKNYWLDNCLNLKISLTPMPIAAWVYKPNFFEKIFLKLYVFGTKVNPKKFSNQGATIARRWTYGKIWYIAKKYAL